MDDREATTANRANFAGPASFRPRPIATGCLGVINVGDGLPEDIANERGKLPAGMGLSIREDGQEIEGSPAPKARTPAKEFDPLLVMQDVDQVASSIRPRGEGFPRMAVDKFLPANPFR